MMFDRTYRQRLEADLARWEADGVIAPAAATAIRVALPPLAPGINIAVVVAIVGGLLIAAAFLAFVAAHWIEIARLLAPGHAVCRHPHRPWPRRLVRPLRSTGPRRSLRRRWRHHLWCRDRAGRPDVSSGRRLCRRHAAVGYGRARDSGVDRLARGACGGAGRRHHLELHADLRGRDPHFSFAVFWLIAAGLALAWKSRVAAHLVALAALPWWIAEALQPGLAPSFVLAYGAALLFGADSRLPRHHGRAHRRPGRSCPPMALSRWPAPPLCR